MSESGISRDVQRLLTGSIGSVTELEVLLHLRRNSGQAFEAREVAQATYIAESGARDVLEVLAARGFLSHEGEAPRRYRYQPVRAEVRRTLDELDRVYAQRRVAVIGLIFSGPGDSVRRFSDAFRLRKED